MAFVRTHATKLQATFLFVAIFTLGFMVGNLQSITQAQGIGDTDQAFGVIQETYNLIKESYVDGEKVDVPSLVDGALKGMVESLDDQFSAYQTPQQTEASALELQGSVEGIGATVDTDEVTGNIYVVSLIRGAAAEAAGVLPGDIFWEVDGESAVGITQNDLVLLVRGPAGSEVTIVFKRGEELITFTMTRVRFDVPIVESEILEGDIAHVRLSQFTSNARDLLRNELNNIEINSKKALILDVRGNPGGLLSSVVDISSLFVEDGVILYEAFGDGTERTFDANGDYLGITIPIVLLTDEGSASASELLAGALQDLEIATVIGETSFGKGTVQTVAPLSNGGSIRLTIARWLTPNRNWIHELGITPDIVVAYDPVTDGVDVDPQLDAAIEYINNLE